MHIVWFLFSVSPTIKQRRESRNFVLFIDLPVTRRCTITQPHICHHLLQRPDPPRVPLYGEPKRFFSSCVFPGRESIVSRLNLQTHWLRFVEKAHVAEKGKTFYVLGRLYPSLMEPRDICNLCPELRKGGRSMGTRVSWKLLFICKWSGLSGFEARASLPGSAIPAARASQAVARRRESPAAPSHPGPEPGGLRILAAPFSTSCEPRRFAAPSCPPGSLLPPLRMPNPGPASPPCAAASSQSLQRVKTGLPGRLQLLPAPGPRMPLLIG